MPESGYTAIGLSRRLASGEPPVIVRNHEAELGHFYLDPCNLHPGEEGVVAAALRDAFDGQRPDYAMAGPSRNSDSVLRWPD
jgi:L-seryl-tRNA(Ser) seleniumtransferase